VRKGYEGVKKWKVSRKGAKGQRPQRIIGLFSLRLCVFAPLREMFLLCAAFFHTFYAFPQGGGAKPRQTS
jgi:hypothetical protein